jgi:hypothetical protein
MYRSFVNPCSIIVNVSSSVNTILLLEYRTMNLYLDCGSLSLPFVLQALNGPHHYQIADQGGLLVAVPSDTPTPNVVKFSTDEGRCWHEYTFTNETIVMTGEWRRLWKRDGGVGWGA